MMSFCNLFTEWPSYLCLYCTCILYAKI